MSKFEKPHVQKLENPRFDSFRPDGKNPTPKFSFRESLKVTSPNEEEARKKAERKYTEERLIGRNGRGERP